MSSRFVQITVVPGAIVIVCGEKLKLSTFTSTALPAGDVAACAAGSVISAAAFGNGTPNAKTSSTPLVAARAANVVARTAIPMRTLILMTFLLCIFRFQKFVVRVQLDLAAFSAAI